MTNLVAFGVVLALCLVAVWAAPRGIKCPECPNRIGPEVCAVDKDGNSKTFENKCMMDSANCRDSKISFTVKSTGSCPGESKMARARLARALQKIAPTNPKTLAFQMTNTGMDSTYDGSGGNGLSMDNGVPLEEKAVGGPQGIMPVDGDCYDMPEEVGGDVPDGKGFVMPDMGNPQADMPPIPEDGPPVDGIPEDGVPPVANEPAPEDGMPPVANEPAPEPEKLKRTLGDTYGETEDQDDNGKGRDDKGKGKEKGDKGKGKGNKGKGRGDKEREKSDRGKGREEKRQDRNEMSRGDRGNFRSDKRAPEPRNIQNVKPAEGNRKSQPKAKEEKKADRKSGKEQKKADKLERKEQKKADKSERKEEKKGDMKARKEEKKDKKSDRKENKKQ